MAIGQLLAKCTPNTFADEQAKALSVLDIDPSQDDMTRLFTKILWERTANAKDLNALLTGMPSLAEECRGPHEQLVMAARSFAADSAALQSILEVLAQVTGPSFLDEILPGDCELADRRHESFPP